MLERWIERWIECAGHKPGAIVIDEGIGSGLEPGRHRLGPGG
jgi:hypothetical protein